MYLLMSLPRLKRAWHKIPNCEIPDDAHINLRSSLTAVMNHFSSTTEIDISVRRNWNEWYQSFAPVSANSDEYCAKLGKHFTIPLREVLFENGVAIQREVNTLELLMSAPVNDIDTLWPELKALAMPSVHSTFNRAPPAPRLFMQSDVDWQNSMTHFTLRTNDAFYNVLDFTVNELKEIIKTTLTYTCKVPSYSENRPRLIMRYKDLNKEFISCIHKSLSPGDHHCFTYHLNKINDDEVVCKLEDIEVTTKTFRSLQVGSCISMDLMDVFIKLFQKRNSRIIETYSETYGHLLNYRPLKKSLFFRNIVAAVDGLRYELTILNSEVKRVYILCQDEGNMWYMLNIDMSKHFIYVLHPTYGSSSEEVGDNWLLRLILPSINTLQIFLRDIFPDQLFQYAPYKYQYYDTITNATNSGILVTLMIYHLELNCPIVCDHSHYNKFRANLGYWILVGHLPY